MSSSAKHPGTFWRKCDFQIHTPRDPQWSGSPHLPGGSESDEQARRLWAQELVAACRERGLGAIAITDHHDFVFIPYVQAAAEEAKRTGFDLWVFPGVEVTCDDSVQCLVLFDPSTNETHWNRFFGGIFRNIDQSPRENPTSAQALPIGREIEDFIRELSKDTMLSNRYIVLPHASNDGAHKSVMRDGFHIRFSNLEVDAFYCEKPHDVIKPKVWSRVHGKSQDWGKRRRALIPTGDNRVADFERVGKHVCWIRLGEPTVESLRQAALADISRITYETPKRPSEMILSATITSTLTGADFSIEFNESYNALIGGRGSGKSSVLEYIRFGIGRAPSDYTSVEIEHDQLSSQKSESLIRDTLLGGFVKVRILRSGLVEDWTRKGGERSKIYVSREDGSSEVIDVKEAQRRFRARAFQQKQLSTILLSDQEQNAIDQITGIAAAELIDQRRTIQGNIEAYRLEFLANVASLVEFWRSTSELDAVIHRLSDTERQLVALKGALSDEGLSESDQSKIAMLPIYSSSERLFSGALKLNSERIERLSRLIADASPKDGENWQLAGGLSHTQSLRSVVEASSIKMAQGIEAVVRDLNETANTMAELHRSFDAEYSQFKADYLLVKEREQSLGAKLAEVERLESVRNEIIKVRDKLNERLAERSGARSDVNALRGRLFTESAAMKDILSFAAGSVEGMSGGALVGSVVRDPCPDECVQILEEIFGNLRIRDLDRAIKERVEALHRDGSEFNWDNVCEVLLSVLEMQAKGVVINGERGSDAYAKLTAIYGGDLTSSQVQGAFRKVTSEVVAKALGSVWNYRIQFHYIDGNRKILFSTASPGQQASALLRLLLSQNAGTLLIDQPEDDLDNKVIMDIVSLLQSTKHNRQLIFTTHNPNLVVNGDADKVVALESAPEQNQDDSVSGGARIRVGTDGAIETQSVKDSITSIMEGGRAAFDLRLRKYQF